MGHKKARKGTRRKSKTDRKPLDVALWDDAIRRSFFHLCFLRLFVAN